MGQAAQAQEELAMEDLAVEAQASQAHEDLAVEAQVTVELYQRAHLSP